MDTFLQVIIVYIFGGLTLLPVVISLILLHAYITFPRRSPESNSQSALESVVHRPGDDEHALKSGSAALADKFQRGREPDVAAGYFAVCREYVPGGINGKPPERTTPAGAVVAAESPSVYQSMYRSIFDRKQGPSLDNGKGNMKNVKKARNVFFVVLRHGHLMLYDDSEQLEVRHVISLAHHDVSIYAGGDTVPEGELWIKRNALCLTRKRDVGDVTSTSKPFYLFSENCSEKEDFYFALLQNQEQIAGAPDNPPKPLHFDVKDIITLVQQLHSSEEHLQTRWINGLVGRLFLAIYKTPEIENLIRQKITKKISRVKKPAFLSDIVLQKIHLGEGAPYITNPRLKDLTVDGDCCAEADFKYHGNFRLEVAATARIELGSRFKAREVNLVLAVVIKKLEGRALVRFKPPPSNRIWISFETMPDIDMTIEPIVSSRQITYNIILRAIESRIREVIAETLVLPHWDDCPFTDTTHQRFRGGIWADDRTEMTAPDSLPINTEKEAQDDTELEPSPGLGDLKVMKTRDDRIMSMPALNDPSAAALKPRKGVVSSYTAKDQTESASSTGIQKRPQPPKVMRSHSFATVASPVVTTETANVDSNKAEMKDSEQRDATSSMVAISNRSQPVSPTETPVGSPSRPSTMAENSRRGSFSSTSSKREESLQEAVLPPTSSSSRHASMPGTPTSVRTNSTKSGVEQDSKRSALQSVARTIAASDKRTSTSTIGNATAAAKKWGWGVLTRNTEQKSAVDGIESADRAGTPEHPIGRGRPLPPPGTPLPPPERPSSKTSPINIPKRKPLPPPKLPQRRQNISSRAVPAPPLPARHNEDGPSTAAVGDDGLLVVEAPPDSEPTSPLEDGGNGHVQPLEVVSDTNNKRKSRDTGGNPALHDDEYPAAHASTSFEDHDGAPGSWSAAQEEETRSKSVWLHDNEHS
ncbi:hypothetical protein MMC16_005233 [Acarospora aff. strigata]|nr:hypothetical protein [Acarospora aff. strigata]